MIDGVERLRRLGEVELWCIDLALSAAEWTSQWEVLSAAERTRAGQFTRPELRRRFVASRAGLRRVLASYRSTQAGAIQFLEGTHGKPAVEGGPRFSLSHSGELALCAVSIDRELGVDVEQLRPVSEADAIVSRWFPPEEQRAYRAEPPLGRDAAFLALWTRREAYLKALGIGLSDPEISQTIDPACWEVHSLRPREGYVGALVVERVAPRGKGEG